MDTSYVSAIGLLVVGVLQTFGIVVEANAITGIITGVIALVIAIKQKKEKNLSLGGFKRI